MQIYSIGEQIMYVYHDHLSSSGSTETPSMYKLANT